ncbi:MAG: hypothetical protein K2G93_02420, partial [Rikenella sp.]|nr:hypothetical protein [Rikenella sp.]
MVHSRSLDRAAIVPEFIVGQIGENSMSERKIIAVIAGGDSSEDVISYKSGAQVYGCLDRAVYEPYFVVLRRGVWRVNPV